MRRGPMVMLPAGSDWAECKNSAGRSDAIERLNRLRELFYAEPNSLGERKLPLTRQSMSPRWRSYAENAHWSVGKVLYATVNLPADNNHYLTDAGRNSEYEDRLVANRFWLNRLFAIARRDKLEALVLFSEGDLKAPSQPTGLRALLRAAMPDNDGFAETRREVLALAQQIPGQGAAGRQRAAGQGRASRPSNGAATSATCRSARKRSRSRWIRAGRTCSRWEDGAVTGVRPGGEPGQQE